MSASEGSAYSATWSVTVSQYSFSSLAPKHGAMVAGWSPPKRLLEAAVNFCGM